jgi:hypothetical protein
VIEYIEPTRLWRLKWALLRWRARIGWMFGLCVALALLSGDASADLFRADSNISVTSTIVANNTTAIVLTTKKAIVYQVDAYNNGTSLAYIKLYNAASATCGQSSPLPQFRAMIPYGASSSGGGFVLPNINGDAYINGVTMCVTGGISDTDTTSPTASEFIVNVHFQNQQ